jgi:hypothetical protein
MTTPHPEPTGCPRCGAAATVALLCEPCAGALAPCDGLLREHLVSRAGANAAAWLLDGFGAAHPVPAAGCRIGRGAESDLALLHGSVSRDHVELSPCDGGWQVRDLGSRNGTRVEGRRVEGRARLDGPTVLAVGSVKLWFTPGPLPPAAAGAAAETTHAITDEPRFTLREGGAELCVLVAAGGGGAVLVRGDPAAAWSEVSLSPLELQLLRRLCSGAVADAGSPSPSRGCVATKQLAIDLPFQSNYADDENVRQVVRRVRAALTQAGAAGVIGSVQGRGYFVAWAVTAS